MLAEISMQDTAPAQVSPGVNDHGKEGDKDGFGQGFPSSYLTY